MIKKKMLLKRIVLISIILFILTSLFSLFLNLIILNKGIKIGLPLTYYFEFYVRGNDFKNFNYVLNNILIDSAIHIMLAVIIERYFIQKRKKTQAGASENK